MASMKQTFFFFLEQPQSIFLKGNYAFSNYNL